VIKEWFASYVNRRADVTFDYRDNLTTVQTNDIEPWRVTLVDTGEKTMTGGRIRRAAKYLTGDAFCMTYGDGVSDVDIGESIRFHREHGKKVTMTAVQPDQRFGMLTLSPGEQLVTSFQEKPRGEGVWANAGYFVLDRSVVDYIDNDDTMWEIDPLQQLARENEVMANRHQGFWMPMDTLRDKNVLEQIWASGNAPWKRW
jgi:glucose-1-phosphate cytidylyltransferase